MSDTDTLQEPPGCRDRAPCAPCDSLETNFEAARFTATTRETLDPAKLRRQFALVPQDLVIFSGSIAENIRFVRPEASLEQVRRLRPKRRLIASPRAAARIATSVGKSGMTLSVGQRQRLVIARAIVKNAPALMFGKATSALDAESERLARQARSIAWRTDAPPS